MKSLIYFLVLIFATINLGFANTIEVKGASARSIMEALSASGFEVSNINDIWSGKTLSVETNAIICHYTAVISPDGWMNNVKCFKDNMEDQNILKESLALSKSIVEYADLEAGAGNRWVSVNAIKCSLIYDNTEYNCKIEVNGN